MTYEDLSMAIYYGGMTEEKLLTMAKYRPGKTWADFCKASCTGTFAGFSSSFEGNINAITERIREVVVMRPNWRQ